MACSPPLERARCHVPKEGNVPNTPPERTRVSGVRKVPSVPHPRSGPEFPESGKFPPYPYPGTDLSFRSPESPRPSGRVFCWWGTWFVRPRAFVYSGGSGNAIARVEISADGGESWQDATLRTEEAKEPTGHHFGWVRWTAEVAATAGAAATTVCCRATDAAGTRASLRALLFDPSAP